MSYKQKRFLNNERFGLPDLFFDKRDVNQHTGTIMEVDFWQITFSPFKYEFNNS